MVEGNETRKRRKEGDGTLGFVCAKGRRRNHFIYSQPQYIRWRSPHFIMKLKSKYSRIVGGKQGVLCQNQDRNISPLRRGRERKGGECDHKWLIPTERHKTKEGEERELIDVDGSLFARDGRSRCNWGWIIVVESSNDANSTLERRSSIVRLCNCHPHSLFWDTQIGEDPKVRRELEKTNYTPDIAREIWDSNALGIAYSSGVKLQLPYCTLFFRTYF